ncbi:MAG TPA: NAD(+) synthase [Verrucomicrobiae bacterium]|nr:NAD(+) synthase [Verrucomicrobiae bacterium]
MDKVVNQIDSIVLWLREKVESANAKGLVVGVSGGIDSAVVSGLIKKAFPNNSLGIIMPCHSNPQDAQDALDVVRAVELKHLTLDITKAHDAILSPVKEDLTGAGFSDINLKLSDANLRARLRMSTLYSVANALNYLVVGTDNAAEVHTGYFTKYGDGGVDILPISQFLKREVRALAEGLGIPRHIITKAPSAGLWAGQTDEAEMGVTYDEIDNYLSGQEVSAQAARVIERLNSRTAHKRVMPPAYPRNE